MKVSSPLYLLACLMMILNMGAGCSSGPAESTPAKPEEKARTKATISDVERGIRSHIQERAARQNGYFEIENDSLDRKLRLVRVHTEYLSVLGEGEYFACVDLADTAGDVYDVDFFMRGHPDSMKVSSTSLHKLNGKPFYSWQQAADKTWHKVPVQESSNALLGVIEGEDHFDFHYEARLPQLDTMAELWIPLAQNDWHQEVSINSLQVPGDTALLRDQYGNRILYSRLSAADANKYLAIHYSVRRREKSAYPGQAPPQTLQGLYPLLPTGGRFAKIVNEVLAGKEEESKLLQARALYDYVIQTMRYAKQGKYGTGDANYACDSRSGNCTEFHSLFISLARTAEIPARFAIGAAIPSERNEGGVNGYHCWAEFYAEGKWWPVDISEANKYSALATYYFGHHPANRIELSRGRDLIVEPTPESGKIPFLAYPLLEVEGQPQKVETDFSFERKKGAKDRA